jgi:uncharacterized protein (TIGR02996 family)
MSDDSALLKAIIAHADEDTPRLAYADWLDEHGDSTRAEFIRTQIRLADLTPAHLDWVGLCEQQERLFFSHRALHLGSGVSRANRFFFTDYIGDALDDSYRRGFPYAIDYQTDEEHRLTQRGAASMIAELTRLVATTTIRAFHPYELTPERLAELLAAPVTAQLAGLDVQVQTTRDDPEEETSRFHRLVATSPNLGRLRELGLPNNLYPDGLSALTASETLGSVTWLEMWGVEASEREVRAFVATPWLRRLRRCRVMPQQPATAGPLVAGLGELPELHTLELAHPAPPAFAALAAGRFPALARLDFWGPLDTARMRTLARARFPALTCFEANDFDGPGLTDAGFRALLRADWFGRLHALDLSYAHLGDKGIAALAAHPVTPALRSLELQDNAFGPAGLAAFTRRADLPVLIVLDLRGKSKIKGTVAELAATLSALRTPQLRRLELSYWPLGSAGAKALAANPTLANLTRLDLDSCSIGDTGAQALFSSPHLQKLVDLSLTDNPIKTAADALADPAVLPHLSRCALDDTQVPEATLTRLKRKRPGLRL